MITELAKPKKERLSGISEYKAMVWVKIPTDDHKPMFRAGDMVGGIKTAGHNIDNQIGRECIVCLDDNTTMIKYVLRGASSGRYDLRSFFPRTDDIRNVKIRWAAPIRIIVRDPD